MPIKRGDKFSDNTNATWSFGNPDFNTNAFLVNRGLEIKECVCEIEEDKASKKSTERIHTEEIGPVIRKEAIGFLGLPCFRPNKMRVYNATSRVLHLFVYDDENKTRSQVLMIHRSLLDFPSLVISLHLFSALSLSTPTSSYPTSFYRTSASIRPIVLLRQINLVSAVARCFSSCRNPPRSLSCTNYMRCKRAVRV
jgi:hypothetical protein